MALPTKMDYADEINGKFVQLDELKLIGSDHYLVTMLVKRFSDRDVYFQRIGRGSSHSIKLVAKPTQLFPFLIKIGDVKQIEQEYKGDQLIRLRVPPLNIPPLEDFKTYRSRAALMYRYITGGRVNDLDNRADIYLGKVTEEKGDGLLVELFDVVLRKCHWMDGDFTLRQITLPDLPVPENGVDSVSWQEISELYNCYRDKAICCKAPCGVIHGDLHSKNILVTRNQSPVILDFLMAQSSGCVYWDYCKLETSLQFHIDSQVSDQFWSVSERIFSSEPLILPRSNRGVARYIHTIRSTLWRACLSKSVGLSDAEIDIGYRAHILYLLGCFFAKMGNSTIMRQRAYREIKSLSRAEQD